MSVVLYSLGIVSLTAWDRFPHLRRPLFAWDRFPDFCPPQLKDTAQGVALVGVGMGAALVGRCVDYSARRAGI